jgi:hypothetical protein
MATRQKKRKKEPKFDRAAMYERMREKFADTELAVKAREKPASSYIAPSREGKLHLSAWLDPAYKSNLRAIQMKHPSVSFQDLYSEALNDLFAKHGLNAIGEDQKSQRHRK